MIDQLLLWIEQNVWTLWIVSGILVLYFGFDKRDLERLKKFGPSFIFFAGMSIALLFYEFGYGISELIQNVASGAIGIFIGYFIGALRT